MYLTLKTKNSNNIIHIQELLLTITTIRTNIKTIKVVKRCHKLLSINITQNYGVGTTTK
jgi:hypothetical protein